MAQIKLSIRSERSAVGCSKYGIGILTHIVLLFVIVQNLLLCLRQYMYAIARLLIFEKAFFPNAVAVLHRERRKAILSAMKSPQICLET